MPKSKECATAPLSVSRKCEPAAAARSPLATASKSHSLTHPTVGTETLAPAGNDGTPAPLSASFAVAERVKEMVRLAQEQGYLTHSDLSEALPDQAVSPEELEEIHLKLRNLEIDIVDQAEVDRIK